MSRIFLVLAFLSTMLWLGCGDDRPAGTAGNDSALVGGPCMNNSECVQGLCEDGFRFPGGMCTLSCGNSGNCPQGSSCGELASGWVCLVNCRDASDCRTDYLCEPLSEAGTNQAATVAVCIGPAR